MAQWRVAAGLVGGLLVHFVIGTVYITGNISVYAVSYFRLQGDSVTLQDAVILLPIQIVTSTFTLYVGAHLLTRLGTRLTVLLGNSIVILATFCGSFCTRFWTFCIVYAAGFGLGDGISYMTPLVMGWSYYPAHKGRVTGLILLFFALGTTVFGFVSTAIINPDNRKADIEARDGKTIDHYYPEEIADGFPAMMRWLSLCYLCLSLLAVFLLVPVRTARVSDEGKEPIDSVTLPSVQTGLRHPLFWLLFTMALFSSSTRYLGYGLYLASVYKAYGEEQINDDEFLTTVGAVSFLMNGLFRFILAQTMDLTSFKAVYSGVLVVQVRPKQLIVSVSLPFVSHSKPLFFLWVCISMACEGGHFSLFPAVTAKLFGKAKGGTVYSLLFYNFSLSSLLSFALQLFLVQVLLI